LQIFHRIEFGKDEKFSAGWIYAMHRLAEAVYQGMNPDSLVKILCEFGSVPTKYYNELYEMPEMREKVLANPHFEKLLEIAKKTKIEGFVGFLRSNYDDMKKALYEKQYPLFAASNKYFGEPHAILIIGWDEKGFIIQNSWGENWGNKGRKTIPLSAVSYSYLLTDEVLKLKFTDVSESDWSFKAIKECVFNGLMKGISDTEFAPKAPVTREQLAQFGVNMLKIFDDIIKIRADKEDHMAEEVRKLKEWAYANGYKG
jgi:hypothetical protein